MQVLFCCVVLIYHCAEKDKVLLALVFKTVFVTFRAECAFAGFQVFVALVGVHDALARQNVNGFRINHVLMKPQRRAGRKSSDHHLVAFAIDVHFHVVVAVAA